MTGPVTAKLLVSNTVLILGNDSVSRLQTIVVCLTQASHAALFRHEKLKFVIISSTVTS